VLAEFVSACEPSLPGSCGENSFFKTGRSLSQKYEQKEKIKKRFDS
jgi:hypothetical protein